MPLRVLKGHKHGVNGVAVLGSGRVVSASDDGTLRVWDVDTGEQLDFFRADARFSCCAVMPDGRTVVAGDVDGKVHVLRYEE